MRAVEVVIELAFKEETVTVPADRPRVEPVKLVPAFRACPLIEERLILSVEISGAVTVPADRPRVEPVKLVPAFRACPLIEERLILSVEISGAVTVPVETDTLDPELPPPPAERPSTVDCKLKEEIAGRLYKAEPSPAIDETRKLDTSWEVCTEPARIYHLLFPPAYSCRKAKSFEKVFVVAPSSKESPT
jgi:hypothetical protein